MITSPFRAALPSLGALLALLVITGPARPAAASVVQHVVTPTNVARTDGIDVSARRRPNGDLVLTLRVERAPSVYRPRLKLRPQGPETRVDWEPSASSTHVAIIRIPPDAREAVVTVMRDFGVVGHHYVIRARDWM